MSVIAADYRERLTAVGVGDGRVDNIAAMALVLAALDRPGISFQKYDHHLKILGLDLAAEKLVSEMAADRARALSNVMHGRHDYSGNRAYYDDLQNANLMSVIDSRKGLPVALAVLYIQTARSMGWPVEGLKFPRHFLIRLYGVNSSQVIIDPFNDGKIMDARDLRRLIQEFTGAEATLRPEYYQPVTDREILVRLLDNIKVRCLKASDLGQTISILSRLVLINPGNMHYHYELGMLLAHVGKNEPAIHRLRHCLDNIEKFDQNDLIRQQIVNMLQDMATDNIVRLPEVDK
ncbi:MAG: hypothetical protein GXP02_01220 [Alphaproteobacteria bacterium]|nr:hypothetical protein [Alphaproteobacteria bacterium]